MGEKCLSLVEKRDQNPRLLEAQHPMVRKKVGNSSCNKLPYAQCERGRWGQPKETWWGGRTCMMLRIWERKGRDTEQHFWPCYEAYGHIRDNKSNNHEMGDDIQED